MVLWSGLAINDAFAFAVLKCSSVPTRTQSKFRAEAFTLEREWFAATTGTGDSKTVSH